MCHERMDMYMYDPPPPYTHKHTSIRVILNTFPLKSVLLGTHLNEAFDYPYLNDNLNKINKSSQTSENEVNVKLK